MKIKYEQYEFPFVKEIDKKREEDALANFNKINVYHIWTQEMDEQEKPVGNISRLFLDGFPMLV
ncbi:MAG: hypothetical protein NTZ48_06595 [Candidatus Omnitrophica bacterium]|nr:hypothetical protein [Candidatus Omnitrophota bacterium]